MEGFLQPSSSIDIVSPETGIVSVKNVSEGDQVKAGDVLIELDSDVLKASLSISNAHKNSQADVMAAQTEYDVAQLRHDELLQLHKEEIVSADELKRAKSQLVIASSRLENAKKELQVHAFEYDRIQKQIKRRTIISPINGVVTLLNKEVGEMVSMNQGVFLQVVDVSQLKMVSYIPYDQSNGLEVGQIVNIQLELDGAVHEAKLKYIAPIIDPASSTVKVELIIDNQHNILRSGVAAKIMLDSVESEDEQQAVNDIDLTEELIEADASGAIIVN